MTTNPKVLVSAPVYDGMSYCFIDFVNHLKAIDYDNFDIVFFDNSRSKKFFKEIRKIPGITVFYDETEEEKNVFRLVSSRNKILDYAREKNYDYLLMMDCDVMVSENLIKKLIGHGKEVVSGLYFNLFNVDNKQKLLPVCYKALEQEDYEKLKEKNLLPDFIKSRFDLRRNITKEEIESGKLLEVMYPSAGCMLLSKVALNSGAKYGLLDETKGLKSTDDIYFFKELRKKGFELYCDAELICKHNIFEKYKDGKVHGVYREKD